MVRECPCTFQLALESLPSHIRVQGTRWGWPCLLCPAPLKAYPLNPSFGPTLTAWPLCQPQQLGASTGSLARSPLLVRGPPELAPGDGRTQPTVRSPFPWQLPSPAWSWLSPCLFTWQDGEGLGLGRALPLAPVDRPLSKDGGGGQAIGPWLPWRRTWCRVVPSQWCSPTFPREE